jgi:hypothetical protein
LAALTVFLSASVISFSAAYAAEVEVSVPRQLDGDVSAISYQKSDLSKIMVEAYNTGSLSYLGRSKVELYLGGEKVFTAWTEGREMAPGKRSSLPGYWYTNSTGSFEVLVKHYFGDSSSEYRESFEKAESNSSSGAFDICNFRAYKGRVVMDVRSSEDVTGAVLMPDRFPDGWVFEQAELGNMRKGESRTVVLRYSGAGLPVDVDFVAASDSGSRMTRETFLLKVESGPLAWLQEKLDFLMLRMSGR